MTLQKMCENKKAEKALNKINERIKREVKVIYNRTGYVSLAMLLGGVCFAIINECSNTLGNTALISANALLCSGMVLGAWSIDIDRMENISNEEMCKILKDKEAVNNNIELSSLEDLMAKYKDTYANLYLSRKELGKGEFKKQEADLKSSYTKKFESMNAEMGA